MKGLTASVARSDGRVAKSEPMGEWLPIATAPRDGTPILIFQPDGHFGGDPRNHHMPQGALAEREFTYRTDDPRLQHYDDERWAIGYWRPWGGWGNRNRAAVEPTHWMPLPAPPRVPQSPGDKARDDHNPKADGEQD